MINALTEGIRIYRRAGRVKRKGWKHYSGNATSVCNAVVQDCYNGRYFQTSAGHFSGFYCRDFGMSVDALLKMGYRQEILKTLRYVLQCFQKVGKITTTITPKGVAFDYPHIGPDSLAFLIYSLDKANAKKLISDNKTFLNKEISRYFSIVDKNGLVKEHLFVSSMKDSTKRDSSCYDNCMLGMLARLLSKLGLDNPFEKFNYKKLLLKEFWNGAYFYEDLQKKPVITGDANVFPFWCEIITDKAIAKKALLAIKTEHMNEPFPLRYTEHKVKEHDIFFANLFVSNYLGNTIWLHLGLCYVDVLLKFDPKQAKIHIKQYKELVEKNHNFLEIFNPDGTPFKTAFYHSDEGMIWAAKLAGFL